MGHWKYSWKCPKCGQKAFRCYLSDTETCPKCQDQYMERRKVADFFRPKLEWLLEKLRECLETMNEMLHFVLFVGVIFALALLLVGGLVCGAVYSEYKFNKRECERLQSLGNETDFSLYGGCFVRKGKEWVPFHQINNVNFIEK